MRMIAIGLAASLLSAQGFAQVLGAPIPGVPGSVWADANNDGYVDGYVSNGRYYAGRPSGFDSSAGASSATGKQATPIIPDSWKEKPEHLTGLLNGTLVPENVSPRNNAGTINFLYRHLTVPGDGTYIQMGRYPARQRIDWVLYSCTPDVRVKISGAQPSGTVAREGQLYVSRYVTARAGKVNVKINPSSDASIGEPYFLVGTVGDPAPQDWVTAMKPICADPASDQATITKRFGAYADLADKTIQDCPICAEDYYWAQHGKVLVKAERIFGKEDYNQRVIYSYDAKSGQLLVSYPWATQDPVWKSQPRALRTDFTVMAFKQDILQARQERAQSGGGGGFMKALGGAVAGFAGGAQGGGTMASAVGGAVAGAVGGAAGLDESTVYQSMSEASAEEQARQAELKAIADANLAGIRAKAAEQELEQKRAADAQAAAEAAAKERQQAEARDMLAQKLGEANAIRAEQMAEANATGNVAAQQKIAGYAGESARIAKQYGIEEKVSAKEAEYQAKLADYERANKEREEAIRRAAEQEAENQKQLEASRARAAEAQKRHEEETERVRLENERRRREADARLAEAERKKDETNRPIAFEEGVVLCQPIVNDGAPGKQSRCYGPLQMTIVEVKGLSDNATRVNIGQACGSNKSLRDLGTTSGYRAFGCGFGIHPDANMRDYPGNTDVRAQLGVGYVLGTATFMCPRSTYAYCRGR